MNLCYSNDQFLPSNKVGIDINELRKGKQPGLFESLRTYHGEVFLFKGHMKRLRQSAKLAQIKLSKKDEEMKDIIERLLIENSFEESTIQIIITTNIERQDTGMLHVLVTELTPYPSHLYTHGVKVVTHPHKRELPEAKMLNYLTAMTLEPWKRERGAFEILYTNEGKVLEATTSNFFIFKGNTLVTPKEDVLAGITRNIVIQMAKKYFKIEERDIKISELTHATEAFITATKKQVMPVVQIDDQHVGDGKVGRNTKRLMVVFEKLSKSMESSASTLDEEFI